MPKRVREDEEEAAPRSILTESAEMSFPRGGETVLTPLELKQVSNQAKSDVLFEQKNAVHSRKKKKVSSEVSRDIDVLTYDFLQPGAFVLAEVVHISKIEVTVSLAANLYGHIPVTNVSAQINELLDDYESDSDSEDEKPQKPAKEVPALSSIFHLGQFVRAVVVDNTTSTGKKRIELSVEPSKVNKGMEKADFGAHSVVQASLKSVEDHGAILDVGHSKLSGFISKKELEKSSLAAVEGMVVLVSVHKNNGRTLTCKLGSQEAVQSVSNVHALLPGALVDTEVVSVSEDGLYTKTMGICMGSVNCTHTGIYEPGKLAEKYQVGSPVRARITASYLSEGETKLQLSVLPHILSLEPVPDPLVAFPAGHVFDSVVVKGLDEKYIFVDIGSGNVPGQVHKSRVSKDLRADEDIHVGTSHPARVLGYCALDNVYTMTLNPEDIGKKFLNLGGLPLGAEVECVVENIVPGKGIEVRVEDQFEGLVPTTQISDARMAYPERKYKVGKKVKGRALRIAQEHHRPIVHVTLKKLLQREADEELITSYDQAEVGKSSYATVEKFYPSGCLVSFFGWVKAFLPNSEISESFVRHAEDQLKLGQTIKVRIMEVDKDQQRMRVTRRMDNGSEVDVAAKTVCQAKVLEKQKDELIVELAGSEVRGILPFGQVTDAHGYDVSRAAMKKIAVGSSVTVVVLTKDKYGRYVNVSAKPSLVQDAQSGALPSSYADISISSQILHGWIKNVTNRGVFVAFADNLVGLVPPKFVSDEDIDNITKRFYVGESVSCRVTKTDDANQRFLLSMKQIDNGVEKAVKPVDRSVQRLNEYVPGKATQARIKLVKPTQLTVDLADNQTGRIDVTELYDNFADIADAKKPLAKFSVGDVLDVTVLGYHDARNQTYTEVATRSISHTTIELTTRSAKNLQSLDDVVVGSTYTAFVNNFSQGYVWVNLSPKVRGRVSLMDLGDDLGSLEHFEKAFPIGSALQLTANDINREHGQVVLVGHKSHVIDSIDAVKVGDTVPARVVSTHDAQSVLVQLGEGVSAVAHITDALNDYDQKLSEVFAVDQVVPARVLSVDKPNERIFVSLRKSGEAVVDKFIGSADDVEMGSILRGFIKHIGNNGVFVALSNEVYALVPVSLLSDAYLKDWKQFFHLHQLVKGKVTRSEGAGRITLSLKDSDVDSETHSLKKFEQLEEGDVFGGSIKSVKPYGVFVQLDGTLNVSGLCHISEIADHPVKDLEKIFSAGDRVRVKVLKVNSEKHQMSLGMKSSYFGEVEEEEEEEEMEEAEEVEDNTSDEFMDVDQKEADSEPETEPTETAPSEGLSAGFDWTASILEQAHDDISDSDDDYEEDILKKFKKKSKKAAVEDKTAEINTRAPESVSDFERLLVGNPDSSVLWIQYMSFELQLGDVEKAREVATRALKTINYREEQEKLNVWIARLNLEATFGDDDTLESVFKDACQYMDAYVIHQKLVAIFTASEKYHKATELYEVMSKKFGREHVAVWVAFGSFLIDREDADQAHAVLARALQTLPKRNHIDVVRRFAQLEFTKGDAEQGRSLFEGLLSDVPKRLDIWNVYIDQELKKGERKKAQELFERVTARKLTKKQAKFFFGKWLAYEEKEGDQKSADYVKAKAGEYAQKLADKN